MKRNRKSQRGMSLAEMIVTTAIFAVVFIIALTLYDQGNKVFKSSVESADMQQNTRAGFDRLVSDVRMAGYDADRDGVPARAPSGLWSPLTVYAPGAIVSPVVANGFSYRAVSGGQSGNLEPSPWPTTPGQTFTGDGTVTWLTLGPVYQQPDEQIEFAGLSSIAIRANFDYQTDINNEHGRETALEPIGGQFPVVTTGNDEIVTYALRSDNGPNPDTLQFWADTASPRAAYPGGSPEAQVQIPNVDLCTSGCNNPPYTLMRFTLQANGSPDAGTPVANNIRNLRFFYFTDLAGTTLLRDDDGSALTQGAIGGDGRFVPSNIGGTTNWADRAQRASIQTVRVELVGMNSRPDSNYTNPTETLTAYQHFRTYSLQSNVSPRNLGLGGLSEPETRVPSPPVVTSVCTGACRVTRVTWNPSVTGNVDTYEVHYDTTLSGPFTNIGIVVPGDVVSAPVFNLNPGVTYYFKVVAVNEIGKSEIGDSNYLTGIPRNSTRPGAATALTATDSAAAQANQIALTWTTPERNDPSLANMSCQGTPMSGELIDPAEPIRYRVWRGTSENFNPAATPPQGEIVLDQTVPAQPNGPGGSIITWVDDLSNALAKPPANCKDYWYRVQVYDTCSLDTDPAANVPNNPSTGMSDIFPRAVSGGTDPAVHGYASSTTRPSAPGPSAPFIDYSSGNSLCSFATNTCDVKIVWPKVTTDTSNPTQMITVDQYRLRRERKKATDTTWTSDTVLPVLVNASSDPANMDGVNVVYHDTTAIDKDPNDRRKWYYRYTITALQCGAESDPSAPVQFPASCGLAGSTVIQSGAAAGDGSASAPWVMAANDSIEVIPPPSIQLDRVLFEIYPEPDPSPSNPPLDRYQSNAAPFVYTWSNQSDGQVYRVVITMTNAAGCTEQTERFIQDEPLSCPSATVTQVGASGGSGQGTLGLPWIMNGGDTVTVNAPANGPITSVTFTLKRTPGNATQDGPYTITTAPFVYTWRDLVDNQTYRLNIFILYRDGCTEDIDRYITDEPPPVCTGATASVSGASSGDGLTQATPWVVNGGDVITITPPSGGIINQVVFNTTPVSPAGSALPPSTASTSPYTKTWTDQTDSTIYRIDAVITYAPGCTETVTRYVKDEICAGATVSQTGSSGAGTGLTTSSPWVFNAGDTVTVATPAGANVTNVQFSVFNQPGTTALATSTDASSPYQFSWTDRTDNALYRLEMLVTYTPGCTETIVRYIKDEGACFLTATATSFITVDVGGRAIATITYQISNPSTEVVTLNGIKVDWLRDAQHPSAVLQSITYNGLVTQTITSQAPPTTGLISITPTPPTIGAGTSSYTISLKYDIGQKNQVGDLAQNWVTGLCLRYTIPSFGGSSASCNVFGSISGNPGNCS
ncbi:MAG TPA: fibronectin type III domain-containing protein [Thermoanaerobaculia bacterium]|nr:fibronectin type III domain-containing protein [Thermoanaerobaculia bacterium]